MILFAYSQDDLNLRIMFLFEGTFRLTRPTYMCLFGSSHDKSSCCFFSGNCTNDYEVGEQRHCHTGVTMSLLSNFIIVHAKMWFLHVSLMS